MCCSHRPICFALAICASLCGNSTGEAQTDQARAMEQVELGRLQDVAEIEIALGQLNRAQLAYLTKQREKFAKLSQEERQSLRELHRQMLASADAARMFELLKRYRDWIASLPAPDREQILGLPPAERIEAIKERINATQIPTPDGVPELSPEDRRAFIKWLSVCINDNYDQLVSLLPEDVQQRVDRMGPGPRRTFMMASVLVEQNADLSSTSLASAASMDRLHESLSPSGKARMEEARQNLEVRDLVGAWLRTLRMRMSSISKERIQQFLEEELTDKERRELERLPPEQLEPRLRQLFFERQMNRRRGRRPPPMQRPRP